MVKFISMEFVNIFLQSQIAEGHGYALETHTTTTQDGYIISMFRLKRNSAQKKFGQPVILQHGIIVDGLSWMISGNNSLGEEFKFKTC